MDLFDSVILIDYLNGITQARDTIDQSPEGAISVVTLAEVLTGTNAAGYASTPAFLKTFPLLTIDGAIAEAAARLRQQYRWKLPDAFQAALALAYGLELVTRNTKDFKPDQHLFVRVPYTL